MNIEELQIGKIVSNEHQYFGIDFEVVYILKHEVVLKDKNEKLYICNAALLSDKFHPEVGEYYVITVEAGNDKVIALCTKEDEFSIVGAPSSFHLNDVFRVHCEIGSLDYFVANVDS